MHPTFWLRLSIVMVFRLTPPSSFTFRNHFGAREMPNIGLQRPYDVLDFDHEVHNPVGDVPSSTT